MINAKPTMVNRRSQKDKTVNHKGHEGTQRKAGQEHAYRRNRCNRKNNQILLIGCIRVHPL